VDGEGIDAFIAECWEEADIDDSGTLLLYNEFY
jgi:hypothetical protein